jgi:hypothetical protein
MAELIERLNWEKYEYGITVCRLTRAVKGTTGKRYKFLGAVFDPEDDEKPLYLKLVEIGRGTNRSIRPEFVIRDTATTKAVKGKAAVKASK